MDNFIAGVIAVRGHNEHRDHIIRQITFMRVNGYDRDEPTHYYVNGKFVGSVNYDEHGSSGIEAANGLFELIAAEQAVKIEEKESTEDGE